MQQERTEQEVDKAALRKLLLEERAALSEEYRCASDASIMHLLCELPCYVQAKSVFTYVSQDSEVNTRKFIERSLADGKRVAVPRCAAPGVMEAVLIESLGELREGKYGLLEPNAHQEMIPAREINLTVVPCLSATRDGNRIGYGGGYYDRFLTRIAGQATSVVLCREKQLADSLPIEPHDLPADYVISEEGILRAASQ